MDRPAHPEDWLAAEPVPPTRLTLLVSLRQNGILMGTPFAPTRADVERYRRLRGLGMDLNHRIIKTIPQQTIYDVGDAIGILCNDVLEFESGDMSSVLMDCCLYDWFEDGRNVVQRYSETYSAKPGTDRRYLLDAYLQAKYRVLVVQSAAPGAGIRCQDLLNDEELFVMDLGLSQSAEGANSVIAARTIPLGEYWMTSGAALPINSKEAVQDALMRVENSRRSLDFGPGSVSLLIVRTCLAAGAAQYVRYESAEVKARASRCRPRVE